MRKTACPVVWEGGGAQSPSLDPIAFVPPKSARGADCGPGGTALPARFKR
jgi:hypothetical protein